MRAPPTCCLCGLFVPGCRFISIRLQGHVPRAARLAGLVFEVLVRNWEAFPHGGASDAAEVDHLLSLVLLRTSDVIKLSASSYCRLPLPSLLVLLGRSEVTAEELIEKQNNHCVRSNSHEEG